MSTLSGPSDRPEPTSPIRPEPKPAIWPPRTFLGTLSEGSRDGLLSLGAFREYAAGTRVILEGDTSTHVIAMHGGWVKVIAETEYGSQALLALRSRGELVGEQAALEGEPRSASVITASVVTGYVIQRLDFLRYLGEHPDVHIEVTRALSGKLRMATRRLIDFSGLPAHVRLARVLSELARMNSRQTSEGTELGYTLTQPELAAMVGVSEPSMQRALRRLRESGVLGTGYRKIFIRDTAALDAIAGPDWTGGPQPLR